MNVEQETYKGHEIEIEYDESPANPRTEWDNLTEIHCSSDRYYLGENNHPDAEDLRAVIAEATQQNDFIMWVYAYIHSGTRLSLKSFYGRLPQGHAEFDSGVSGVIIVRKETFMKEFGGKKWSPKRKKRAEEICEADIETFNSYLNGEVYGYMIDDPEGDSCWGFYDLEYCMDEAKRSVDFMVKTAKKKHFEQVKTWIRNNVPLSVRKTMAEAIAV